VAHHLIGSATRAAAEPLCPELIRSIEMWLVLKPAVARAAAAVKAGRYLLVADRFHPAAAQDARYAAEPPAQRGASRPNSFGVTLRRVLAREGATISVSGFDALDGLPILDVKPCKPIFDAPPATAQEDQP
jgi:formylmethanofuran dehydrogenase subunit E